jgi:hypothetical protein
MKKFVTGALGIAAFLALAGLGIGSSVPMPSYAVVYMDDITKTYIALPCVEEWQSKQTQTVTLIRRGTAGEAGKLGYKTDDECREAGSVSNTSHHTSNNHAQMAAQ